MTFQLLRVKIHFPQVTFHIAARLVIEVTRLRVSALPTRRYSPRLHFVAELHDGEEAVAVGAVDFL